MMSARKILKHESHSTRRTIFTHEKTILNSARFVRSAGVKPGFSGVDFARECSNGPKRSDAT